MLANTVKFMAQYQCKVESARKSRHTTLANRRASGVAYLVAMQKRAAAKRAVA